MHSLPVALILLVVSNALARPVAPNRGSPTLPATLPSTKATAVTTPFAASVVVGTDMLATDTDTETETDTETDAATDTETTTPLPMTRVPTSTTAATAIPFKAVSITMPSGSTTADKVAFSATKNAVPAASTASATDTSVSSSTISSSTSRAATATPIGPRIPALLPATSSAASTSSSTATASDFVTATHSHSLPSTTSTAVSSTEAFVSSSSTVASLSTTTGASVSDVSPTPIGPRIPTFSPATPSTAITSSSTLSASTTATSIRAAVPTATASSSAALAGTSSTVTTRPTATPSAAVASPSSPPSSTRAAASGLAVPHPSPTTNPSTTSSPATPSTTESCATYTLELNDSCSSVALANGLSLPRLQALNPSLDCDVLYVGDQVCVRPGTWPDCTIWAAAGKNATCDGLTEFAGRKVTGLNPGLDCAEIQSNEMICLSTTPISPTPCSISYIPSSDDTCASIASAYATSVDALLSWNLDKFASLGASVATCDPSTVDGAICVRPASEPRCDLWVAAEGEDSCDVVRGRYGMLYPIFRWLNPGLECGTLKKFGDAVIYPILSPAAPGGHTMLRRQLLAEATGHNDGERVGKDDLLIEERLVSLFSRTDKEVDDGSDALDPMGGLKRGGSGTRQKAFDAASVLKSVLAALPLAEQMKRYSFKLFLDDLMSAVTIAFILLPQSIAYAGLAEADPYQALICAAFPPVLYALFGGSRQLSIGPEALVSVIVGGTVINEIERHPETGLTMPQISATLALVVGCIAIIMAILKAGFIDNILSGYLLTGFILGVSNLIIVEQMPDLFGLDAHVMGDDSTIRKLITAVKAFGTANKWTIIISIVNVAFLLGAREFKKKSKNKWVTKAPEILVLVIVMILVSFIGNFGGNGIHVLGSFDNRIRAPTTPPLDHALIGRLIQPALTIVLVGYIECQTVTRDFGLRHGYFPSGDQELFSLGFVNFVTSFLGAYPTFGSLPRSRILASAGGRTTLASAMAGVIVLIAFLTLVPALQYLPRATLSSIVFVAALGLIETKEIGFVFRLRAWSEIAMFLATYVITLIFSISVGILLCLVLSALLIVKRTTVTSMSVMGRVHHASDHSVKPTFVNIDEHSDAELLDGVILLRVDVPLLFYNSGQARRSIEAVMQAERRVMAAKNKRRRKVAAEEAAAAEQLDISEGGGYASGGSGDGERTSDGMGGTGGVGAATGGKVGAGVGDGSDEDMAPLSPLPESDSEDDNFDAEAGRRWGALHSWRKGRGRLGAPPSPVPSQASVGSTKDLLGNVHMKKGILGMSTSMSGAASHGSLPMESPTEASGVGVAMINGGEEVSVAMKPMTGASNGASAAEGQGRYAGPHTIVLDLKHCIDLDSAATFVLRRIIRNFRRQGIRVCFCGLYPFQRVLFQRAGLAPVLLGNVFEDMAAAVTDIEGKLDVVDWRRDDDLLL
ncbi:Solute carrier 26 [Irineochytrium annulatum]|nr:Solute carrier 26 [Irineochytrium annulatum]